MKKVIFIGLVLMLFGSGLNHKFYVSLTEIRYNPKSQRIEVTIRVFPEDLDHAILEQTGVQTHLATELEPPEADNLLWEYLSGHFSVEADGEPIKLTYLGKETESDAIWCYLESAELPEPRTYQIHNSILVKTFEEQVNIVQIYQGKWNKGLMLNRDHQTDRLTIRK